MKPLTFVSLFAGIGGIDLGFERAGMRCIAQVEIDPFCRAVLAKNFPHARRFEDVKRFDRRSIRGAVDVVCGGFPCQDISVAGRGVGLGGSRSGLWWEMLRIIRALRPTWIFIENVPALRSRGADEVIAALEAAGYAAWPVVVGAEHVGAPHRRKRVWIIGRVANAHRDGSHRIDALQIRDHGQRQDGNDQQQRKAGNKSAKGGGGVQRRVAVANADGKRCEERHAPTRSSRPGFNSRPAAAGGSWPAGPTQRQHKWEAPRLVTVADPIIIDGRCRSEVQERGEKRGAAAKGTGRKHSAQIAKCDAERPLVPTTDGLSRRLVRLARCHNRNTLRAAGNSVVPIIPELIGRWIVRQHEGRAA